MTERQRERERKAGYGWGQEIRKKQSMAGRIKKRRSNEQIEGARARGGKKTSRITERERERKAAEKA